MTNTPALLAESRSLKLRNLILFQSFFPSMILVAFWFCYRVTSITFPLERTFVTGETILISALLLVGIIIELDHEAARIDRLNGKRPLDLIYKVTMIVAFLLFLVFGYFKHWSMGIEFPDQASAPLNPSVSAAAWAAIILGLATTMSALFVAIYAHVKLQQMELNLLETQKP